jgi:type II secretory pathway pseudopilin PulG
MMTRKILNSKSGVTMIELLIVMTLVVFVLASTSRVLTALVTQFKQQSKITESGVEEIVGYEMLRRDIQSAGYGLATALTDGTDFDITAWTAGVIDDYVETKNSEPENLLDDPAAPPRAIIANTVGVLPAIAAVINAIPGSDYLVIKSILVARDDEGVAGKFHHVDSANTQNTWTPADANLADTDRVIVLTMRDTDHITLVPNMAVADNKFYTTKNATATYAPVDVWERRIVYGVGDASADLSAPFNRADYAITNNPAVVPERCAPGTGVLVKRVMSHDGATGGTFPVPTDAGILPLIDCVADMQVSYVDDANTEIDEISGLGAADVRDQVREVRVYMLVHEGQKDPAFTYPNNSIRVGRAVSGVGRNFDLTTVTDWQNYRWKLLTVAEKPMMSR